MATKIVILNDETVVDFTKATAEQTDVLSTKTFNASTGEIKPGLLVKEDRTVTPDFAEGAYIVSPSSDNHLMSKVIINKPNNYMETPDDDAVLEITKNGVYGVIKYSSVEVDVPNNIPEGYIQPEGLLEVTQNGEYDVTAKATVKVDVPIPNNYVLAEIVKEESVDEETGTITNTTYTLNININNLEDDLNYITVNNVQYIAQKLQA